LLQPLRRTTLHLPPPEQFAYFRSLNTMSTPSEPAESATRGFAIEETTWRFGAFALMDTTVAACRYARTAAHIRRDSLDHWMISVPLWGGARMRLGDTVTALRPGAATVTSLERPYAMERDDSAWRHLFVPRDAFPELGGAIDAARGRPLDHPMGQLLRDTILLFAGHLRTMRETDAPRLAQAMHAAIAAALAPSADSIMQARPQLEPVQIARVKRLIRDNLRSAMLGPDRLCQLAGLSRSNLYRLCEPFGGVAKLIQAERLRQAHRLLSDPAEARSIGQIAEHVGLFDRSSFGRMFRRSFGCSPRELRVAALSGCAAARAAGGGRPAAPQSLTELLRTL